MIRWGISAGTHDASITVMRSDRVVFAAHSERYSKVKNDKDLDAKLIREALAFGSPEVVYWYENPILKATRKLYAGQDNIWLSPKKYLAKYGITAPIKWGYHHASHHAAGYYTRPFDFNDCAVLVIDAIGEWTTTSMWKNDVKIWSANYPASLGLFYSAFTAKIGLQPNCDEYILMGMAAYGNPHRFYTELKDICIDGVNLHRGASWWRPELTEADYFDVAAAVQRIYEEYFVSLLAKAKELTGADKLVFMGGCALNCLGNRLIPNYFKRHWIMPNPGDAGSSLGAILAHTKKHINLSGPYLGHLIQGDYPVVEALKELSTCGVVGVANGRAEFGPRALGNRSLFADPRGVKTKDAINAIKQRQEFRPFAPVIRAKDAGDYFDVEPGFQSAYMQRIVKCLTPDEYPAIVHKDGTSRVQTVTMNQNPGLYKLLTAWKEKTGCPMLLNTSLNIKGMPIVNTIEDGQDFERKYGVKVF